MFGVVGFGDDCSAAETSFVGVEGLDFGERLVVWFVLRGGRFEVVGGAFSL